MNLKLQQSKLEPVERHNPSITITGSKSETNRLLLLQALFPNLKLHNTSHSDDSEVMTKALIVNQSLSTTTFDTALIEVHHAGTAMRFLTAFFAIQEGKKVLLTGSSRMKERPIKILVEALQQLGADITYVQNEGFPPLLIKGKKITQNKVELPAHVSSQYISALLLIAPKLENGLQLTLKDEITSLSYILMTLSLLNEIGVKTSFEGNTITVFPKSTILQPQHITIESDWSSASYYYSIVALSEIGAQITLSSFKEKSLQGDSVIATIYKDFGVETTFNPNNSITITKTNHCALPILRCQLKNSPDIAQTIAVTCFGLGIGCHLTGLHTLKIKETDRLEALKIELSKLGAVLTVSNDSLTLVSSSSDFVIASNEVIATYQDHRMAMAFAPLALKTSLTIKEAEVVSKSYPSFWDDLKSIGFQVAEV